MPTKQTGVTAAPDRTVPDELVNLAVLAIRHGAHRVFLGHEGLGAEFSAPIGWIGWITEKDPILHPDVNARAFMLHHQVGCDVADISTPAWLEERIAAGAATQPVIEDLVELFQAGIRHGWSMKYERDAGEHEIFRGIAEKHGVANLFGMRHDLTGTATNWAYDEEADERGEDISTEVTLSIREGLEPDVIAYSGGSQVDHAHVAALLRQPAPNSVPVAYFDDELEEWVP